MEEIQKRYFTISEVADTFNMSTNLVRWYENYFDLRVPRRGKNHVRYYTKNLMEKLTFIRYLIVVEGYRYDGALRKFKEKYPEKLK
jgi:DNA-binding transcriptional MerR regulator